MLESKFPDASLQPVGLCRDKQSDHLLFYLRAWTPSRLIQHNSCPSPLSPAPPTPVHMQDPFPPFTPTSEVSSLLQIYAFTPDLSPPQTASAKCRSQTEGEGQRLSSFPLSGSCVSRGPEFLLHPISEQGRLCHLQSLVQDENAGLPC